MNKSAKNVDGPEWTCELKGQRKTSTRGGGACAKKKKARPSKKKIIPKAKRKEKEPTLQRCVKGRGNRKKKR